MEEKYGKPAKPTADDDDDEDESTSEEEDDDGELATEALDVEMFDVLNAIRAKDPRVYDASAKFYKEQPDDNMVAKSEAKKEKPMNLRDYHRRNLLEGQDNLADEEEDDQKVGSEPRTYTQEQQDLKNSIVKEMHAAVESSDASDEEAGFLVAKSRPSQPKQKRDLPSTEGADKDPDTFLSNFMASRAWVPTPTSAYAPLESDDEDEDARAEAFETAYNLRFEDPNEANKKITGYVRSAVDKYSVRREELSGRQKAREKEKMRKEEEKAEREADRARLRKLMVDEMQEKAEKIRDAANLKGKAFKMEEWVDILNEDWDDAKWEQLLAQKFGDEYYAERDGDINDQHSDSGTVSKERKPKWDDDIDIKDLVPDFKDEDDRGSFSLSEDDMGPPNGVDLGEEDGEAEVATSAEKSKKSKDRKKEREEKQRAARRDHRILDAAAQQLLDEQDAIGGVPSSKTSKSAGPTFRYRATSPSAYGLTPLEILAADDAQLNNWVGLKKLYPFRDEEKKRKDKKRMSKKGRLREWRKDTFGDRDGPRIQQDDVVEAGRIEKTKKKRRRKGKGTSEQATT